MYHCRECLVVIKIFAQQCLNCKAYNCIEQGAPTANKAWVKGKDVQKIQDIEISDNDRLDTGTRELNRVFGGEGITIGSVNLWGGDPGCGKSTLLLQIMCDLAKPDTIEETDKETKKVINRSGICLYVCAEEDSSAIKKRADRIAPNAKDVYIIQQPDLDKVEDTILKIKPDIIGYDSLQTLYRNSIEGTAGSVKQQIECISWIAGVAKARGIASIVVNHVTKEGEFAGPENTQHKVDGLFMFEVDGQIRIMRSGKNRNGPTNEIAMFRMTKDGLQSIENPSNFLLESHLEGIPGNTIATTAESTRAIMVEVQCLIGNSNSVGQPRRSVNGLDAKRVNQIVAVLSKYIENFDISDRDLYINIAGGLKIKDDTGLDLPVVIAILSAFTQMAIPEGITSWGELGLAGEFRPVQFHDNRIKTAEVMKYDTILGPSTSEESSEGYNEIRSLNDLIQSLELTELMPKKAKKVRKPSKKSTSNAQKELHEA